MSFLCRGRGTVTDKKWSAPRGLWKGGVILDKGASTKEMCACVLTTDYSPTGFSVQGILLAITLVLVARLPFPSGDLPDPGTEPSSPVSPALQADSLPPSHQWSPTKQTLSIQAASSDIIFYHQVAVQPNLREHVMGQLISTWANFPLCGHLSILPFVGWFISLYPVIHPSIHLCIHVLIVFVQALNCV